MIACGDCALNRGVFTDAYGVVGAVGEVVPVDVEIPGCPPHSERHRGGVAVGDRPVTSHAHPRCGVRAKCVAAGWLRARLGRAVTACVGGLGMWLGLLGLFGSARSCHIGWLLPLSGVWLELDPLGGFFMAATGAVAIGVGVYVIGYRHHLGAVPLAVLPVFVAAMLMVPAAGSVTTFLLAWELMAIASLVLVLAEHTRREVAIRGAAACSSFRLRVLLTLDENPFGGCLRPCDSAFALWRACTIPLVRPTGRGHRKEDPRSQ